MPACYDGQGLMVLTASGGITAISPRSTGQTVISKGKNTYCTTEDNTRSICTRMGYLKEQKKKKKHEKNKSKERRKYGEKQGK
jgi:hypothetical protein